jgi:hypothetical protein
LIYGYKTVPLQKTLRKLQDETDEQIKSRFSGKTAYR